MVRLKFDGYCKNCTCADLKLECVEVEPYSNNQTEDKYWTVECIHEGACEKWNGEWVRIKDQPE